MGVDGSEFEASRTGIPALPSHMPRDLLTPPMSPADQSKNGTSNFQAAAECQPDRSHFGAAVDEKEGAGFGDLAQASCRWTQDALWDPVPGLGWLVPPTHVFVTDIGVVPKLSAFYWLAHGHYAWRKDWQPWTLKDVLDEMNPGGWLLPRELTVAAWQNVPAHLWWDAEGLREQRDKGWAAVCQPCLVSQRDVGYRGNWVIVDPEVIIAVERRTEQEK